MLTAAELKKLIGPPRYLKDRTINNEYAGVATGLAWTAVGGEILFVETSLSQGDGKLTLTGNLGDVMKESAVIALEYLKSHSSLLGLEPDIFTKWNIHIHVPEGAIPKDGPSAGGAMCTALVSALTGIPVHADVAMTGEITLRGEVLPIGGLKEKLLAAHRGGIRTVLIPEENERDLVDIPRNIQQHLEIKPVRWIDEVWQTALQHLPEAVTVKEPAGSTVKRKATKGKKGSSIRPH